MSKYRPFGQTRAVLALEDGPCGPVLVACRNLRDAFAAEEFRSVGDAVGWLGREDWQCGQ